MRTVPLQLELRTTSGGLRVVLRGPMEAEFGSLRALFARLSAAPGERARLESQAFIRAEGGVGILMESITMRPGPHDPTIGLRRCANEPGGAFTWRHRPDVWDELAAMLEALIESAAPGHQFLDRVSGEDAMVVVSRGE